MRRFTLAAMGSSSAGTTFLVNELCEGTGTPASWSDTPGTPNWDYTTTILEGTQSLLIATNGVATKTQIDFTNSDELFVYFLMQLSGAGGTSTNIAGLRPNGGGSPVVVLTVSATNKMIFGSSGGTVTSVAAGTTYHVWFHYLKGTGANGVHTVAFSTDGVRPTSGNQFKEVTNAATTAQMGRLEIGSGVTTGTYDAVFDKIRVATTQIGNNGN